MFLKKQNTTETCNLQDLLNPGDERTAKMERDCRSQRLRATRLRVGLRDDVRVNLNEVKTGGDPFAVVIKCS
jgi:hypothetical protein